MTPFKVGEIAILQHGCRYQELNGEEAEVVGGLETRTVLREDGSTYEMHGYLVRTIHVPCPGPVGFLLVTPRQLRRKEPPKREIDQVVRWEDCAWTPRKEQA